MRKNALSSRKSTIRILIPSPGESDYASDLSIQSKSPRPSHSLLPLLLWLTAGCGCARGGLCSALLCCALERKGQGAASQVGSGPGRKERTGQHFSQPRSLTLCSGGRTKFWWRDGTGSEVDLRGSPRGFVCARLVRFIRGERAMIWRHRLIFQRTFSCWVIVVAILWRGG